MMLKKSASFVPCLRRSGFAQAGRIVQSLNGDPAASPLGGAHKRGAPYSSHRAPQRVRLGSSLAAALLDELFEHHADGHNFVSS
jgi:hypothetical protein